jgi:DNA-binding NtrC family response regulator
MIDLVISGETQAYLIIQDGSTRVIELLDGVDVAIGGVVLRRHGEAIEIEGTACVNGDRVTGRRQILPGDAIAIGSILAIAGLTHGTKREGDMRTRLAEIERTTIVVALESHDGNQTRAARQLGISRRTLIYRMEKYGLKPSPAR